MLAIRRPRNLLSFGPYGDLHDDMFRIFGNMFSAPENKICNCDVDVREDEKHIYIDAELAGMTKDDIDITLDDGVLTIRGNKTIEREEEKQNYCIRERRSGEFTRSFKMPSVVDQNHVNASLKDGILSVTLTKKEVDKAKRIEVKVD